MSARARRLAAIVAVAALAWFAVVVVWASRDTHDAVPLGNQPGWDTLPVDPATSVPPQPVPGGPVVVREVRCNAVLEADARSGTLPALPFPQVYNREPCELQHRDGRVVLALDVVVIVAVLAGAALVVVRTSRRKHLPGDVAAAA